MERKTLERKVPTLSLDDYLIGSEWECLNFIDALRDGLEEYGFVILKDHLILQETLSQAYTYAREVFDLPTQVKMKYWDAENYGSRGYLPYKVEHSENNHNPDLKECWHIGRDRQVLGKYSHILAPNVFPKEVPEFKPVFQDLYKAMEDTAHVVLEALALALGYRISYLSEMVLGGSSLLRPIYYPPVKNEGDTQSVRAAAHGDVNLITLLVNATDSGLQLLDKDGTWLDVNAPPGHIILSTGDMLERITEGRIPATIHRVINPPDDTSTRYSMPFFVHPRPEVVLKSSKHPDITAGDFLLKKLKKIGFKKDK